jgi:hypothetical protein
MAHGTPKGKIDEQFTKRVEDLEKKAKEQSTQFKTQSGLRPWHTPESMKDNNLLDVPNLHEPAWNRDKLNQLYSDEILAVDKLKGGVVGDLIGVKRQIDFMAVEERAWGLRHASITRCAAIAHGRLDGHGQPSVGIFATVKNEIENRMKQGAITGASR